MELFLHILSVIATQRGEANTIIEQQSTSVLLFSVIWKRFKPNFKLFFICSFKYIVYHHQKSIL